VRQSSEDEVGLSEIVEIARGENWNREDRKVEFEMGTGFDVPGKKVKRVRHVRDGVLRGVKTYKFFFSGEEESKQSE